MRKNERRCSSSRAQADDEQEKHLIALESRFGRALSCGLNKLIEPTIDGELQDLIRAEIHVLVRLRSTARILLTKRASNERGEVAANLSAFFQRWVSGGGLRWIGNLEDLDHVHFSSHQH